MTRRIFLRLLALLAPAPFVLAPGRQAMAATPPCDDGDDATPAQTTGPFYTPDSPQRTSLREPGIAGTPIVVSGSVLTRDCKPVAGALVDFWHADDRGRYDNTGYKLRGHQFTDVRGRYKLESIVPGVYTGRTRHFHVKVQAPHRRVLTTQLYFPGEPRNARDGLYDPRLLMAVRDAAGGKAAAFDFVLALG